MKNCANEVNEGNKIEKLIIKFYYLDKFINYYWQNYFILYNSL